MLNHTRTYRCSLLRYTCIQRTVQAVRGTAEDSAKCQRGRSELVGCYTAGGEDPATAPETAVDAEVAPPVPGESTVYGRSADEMINEKFPAGHRVAGRKSARRVRSYVAEFIGVV